MTFHRVQGGQGGQSEHCGALCHTSGKAMTFHRVQGGQGGQPEQCGPGVTLVAKP